MWICGLGWLKLTKENRKAQRKPSQWHFAHHRSHLDWPRIEPGPRSERLAPETLAPLRTSPVSLASLFRCAVEEHSVSNSYSLAFVLLLVAEGSDILCRLPFLAQMSPWNGCMAVTSIIKWTQNFNRCVVARLKWVMRRFLRAEDRTLCCWLKEIGSLFSCGLISIVFNLPITKDSTWHKTGTVCCPSDTVMCVRILFGT